MKEYERIRKNKKEKERKRKKKKEKERKRKKKKEKERKRKSAARNRSLPDLTDRATNRVRGNPSLR